MAAGTLPCIKSFRTMILVCQLFDWRFPGTIYKVKMYVCAIYLIPLDLSPPHIAYRVYKCLHKF